ANITQSIQGNKLTMRVMITKQQDQDEQKNQRKKNNLALPDDIVDDIVTLIQQVVNQYPDPDIVQKKLDKLCVDFDLDLLKVVGSATIGNSITYDIQVKGRPQEPTDESTAAIAKNLDNLTPKEPETRPKSGSLLGGLLSQAFKSKKDGKTKEDQPEKTPKAQEEQQKTNPEKTKKAAEDNGKSNQTQEELADEKEPAKSQSKQGNKPGKNQLNVNTKVKRIDPATVEISVRADPKKK
ncbi:MAG: hypothetical protein RLZZ115_3122, partial [Cyanobacteriota bacterium]